MRTLRDAVVTSAAVLVLFALLAPPAAAQAPRPWRGTAGALGLTDEQLDRIDKVRLAFREELLPLEMKWNRLDLELEALYRKGQNRDAKLKEIEALEAEMDKKWEDHLSKVRAVLTDDQKVLFDRYGGLGLGWGPGAGYGRAPRWGLRAGVGRGPGYGWGPGAGFGRNPRYGRGYGPGVGRGLYCPWRRW
ncbi:MAG TPA: Spy/CpxP family protein refolding chaperone [Candidatus Aminicenantes bacterium]|nr:Spy/CpxP family protein refolding chaperone [Candidatus Aminicenantes bacterium]